jgi:hypothetical protein
VKVHQGTVRALTRFLPMKSAFCMTMRAAHDERILAYGKAKHLNVMAV